MGKVKDLVPDFDRTIGIVEVMDFITAGGDGLTDMIAQFWTDGDRDAACQLVDLAKDRS